MTLLTNQKFAMRLKPSGSIIPAKRCMSRDLSHEIRSRSEGVFSVRVFSITKVSDD
jgi:hypothetical protein